MAVIKTLVLVLILLANFVSRAGPVDTGKKGGFPNSVKLMHGGLYIPKSFPFYQPSFDMGFTFEYLSAELYFAEACRFMLIGGAYERKIFHKIYGGVSYTQWEDVLKLRGSHELFIVSATEGMTSPPYIGQLDARINYRMADVYFFYKHITSNTRHSISAGAGASYCWGRNDIVKTFWVNPDPPYDAVTLLESEKAEYWGVVPYLGYDYMFWKNRIAIGPDIRARIYKGRSPVEYNINFHLGVNF